MSSKNKPNKEARKFAVLPPDSVVSIAETAGFPDLQPDIPRLLAEGVSYRLRALIQDARHLMKHSRRKNLTLEDLNKALGLQDVPFIYGHDGSDNLSWQQVKDPVKKDSDLHFMEDAELNLAEIALAETDPNSSGSTTVRSNWLVVEGQQKGSTQQAGRPSRLLSDDLLSYYQNITSAITGFDSDLTTAALKDIRTNRNISPLVPHLVQFIQSGLTSSASTTDQMKLLFLLKALLDNGDLFLGQTPIVQIMCDSARYCVLESAQKGYQQWTRRDFAASLLAQICRKWDNGDKSLTKQQLQIMKDVLKSTTKPLTSQYGAVRTVTQFGAWAIDDVIVSSLPLYWQNVSNIMNQMSTHRDERLNACQIAGALKDACEIYLKHAMHNQMETVPSQQLNNGIGETPKLTLLEKYQTIVDCFGDSLVARLPMPMTSDRKEGQRDETSHLGDGDSHRSGPDMLKEFLQVHIKPESMKQENGNGIKHKHTSSLFARSQADDNVFSSDVTFKSTNGHSSSGKAAKICRKSTDSKSKRHRRSFVKSRMNDVFDLHLMRRRNIIVTYGRKSEIAVPAPPRGVGRPPKKKPPTTTIPLPKISVPPSEYRNLCLKLVPFGKKRGKSKTMSSKLNLSSYFV